MHCHHAMGVEGGTAVIAHVAFSVGIFLLLLCHCFGRVNILYRRLIGKYECLWRALNMKSPVALHEELCEWRVKRRGGSGPEWLS